MKRNSGEIITAICVGLAVASAGITLITANHNAKVVTMAANGKVYAGVQGSFGPGVVSAVQENKGQTALALLAGIASGVGVQQAQKQNNKSEPATPSISNSGNGTVIVNTGSGNTSYTTTKTGAE